MIVMKTALPRRTFLRGVGVTLALPLLDAMVPAFSAIAKTAAAPKLRLGFVYVPNGTYLPSWYPKGEGSGFEFSPILTPLAPYRDRLVVVSGLSNLEAESKSEGGGPHTRGNSAWLSGARPKKTEGADIQLGTTADQMAADLLGKETSLRSLELALENGSVVVGGCEQGYSCAYVNTFSWRTPTTPMPMEDNPRVVFERLFGDGGTIEQRREELRKDRSILDWVAEDIARIQHKLGREDRVTVSEYLDAVRQVEQRIHATERQNQASPDLSLEKPLGIPQSFEEHARLMFDLQVLAYRADITRVVTFQIAREQSNRTYPDIGVSEGHHAVSHHQGDTERITLNTKINTYHVQLFAEFVEKMRSTPDGDGSLLDHSLLLYGAGMGDGDLHSPVDLPLVLVGGGGGSVRGGRHLHYSNATPMANLLVTMLDRAGARVERIGDSTGELAGL